MAARNGFVVSQVNPNKLMISMQVKQTVLAQKDKLMAMSGLCRVDSSSLESINITEPDLENADI